MQTTLPLDLFRSRFSYNPFHFWQLADETITPVVTDCDDLIREYAYQTPGVDSAGRSDIRQAIESAIDQLKDQLRYRPVPHFVEATYNFPRVYDPRMDRIGYAGSDARWLTLQLDEGKIIQSGIEALTLKALAVVGNVAPNPILVYTDDNSDGLIDTFTITFMAAALLDPLDLVCYFNDRDGDDPIQQWKIEPIRATIDTNTLAVTITGAAWLCVPPQDYQGMSGDRIDPSTSAPFATAIDVYLQTCDPTGTTQDTSQAVLIWETRPFPAWAYCPGCAAPGNSLNDTDPAALAYALARVTLRDAERGIVGIGEAIYDATAGEWHSVDQSNCRPPDRVIVRYLAGVPNDARGNVDPFWQKVIADFAAAELNKRVCACAPANKMIYNRQIDRAFSADSKVEGYQVAPADLSNPFGTLDGAIRAWRAVKSLRGSIGVLA